jgi:Polysaccharide biosynthesis protein
MQKLFLKGLGITLLLNLLVKPATIFLVDIKMQNELGAHQYGTFQTVLNFTFLFSMLLDMGMTNFMTRMIAQYPHMIHKYSDRLFTFRLILVLVYVVLGHSASFAVVVDFRITNHASNQYYYGQLRARLYGRIIEVRFGRRIECGGAFGVFCIGMCVAVQFVCSSYITQLVHRHFCQLFFTFPSHGCVHLFPFGCSAALPLAANLLFFHFQAIVSVRYFGHFDDALCALGCGFFGDHSSQWNQTSILLYAKFPFTGRLLDVRSTVRKHFVADFFACFKRRIFYHRYHDECVEFTRSGRIDHDYVYHWFAGTHF